MFPRVTLPRRHYRARRYRAGHYRAGHYRALTLSRTTLQRTTYTRKFSKVFSVKSFKTCAKIYLPSNTSDAFSFMRTNSSITFCGGINARAAKFFIVRRLTSFSRNSFSKCSSYKEIKTFMSFKQNLYNSLWTKQTYTNMSPDTLFEMKKTPEYFTFGICNTK